MIPMGSSFHCSVDLEGLVEVVGFVLRVIPESLVVVSLVVVALLKLVVFGALEVAVAYSREGPGLVACH